MEGNMKNNQKTRMQKHYEKLTMAKRMSHDLCAVPVQYKGKPACVLAIRKEEEDAIGFLPIARILEQEDMGNINAVDYGLAEAFKEAFDSIAELDERKELHEFSEQHEDLNEIFIELVDILEDASDIATVV